MDDYVSSFMKSPVVTVPADVKLIDVINLMRSKSIGSILITQNNELIGIFTDKDVIKYISNSSSENLIKPISQFMTPNPIRIKALDTNNFAYELMSRHNFRHLPVFDGDKLAGIISMRDLMCQILKPKAVLVENMVKSEEHPINIEPNLIPKAKELTGYQMRNIAILAHLYMHDAVTDEIVENLRESELEFFAIIEKCKYLDQRVNIDEKTGLLKYKSDYLLAIIKTASRVLSGIIEQYPVSFIRFDIDDFSIFNNRYGHDVGDKVLLLFSQFLKDNSRPTDYVIRFGGEEFDVILPNTKKEGMICFLKKLYLAMDCLSIIVNSNPIRITVSAGATNVLYNLNNRKVEQNFIQLLFETIQNEADNALYDSKYQGKNRFSIYVPEKSSIYPEIRAHYSSSKK